ncbi:MAG: SlyX family protein [Pseudomonadales bacterium]|nr:SlyX family protein [Pseudomonadales bacterium]MBO7005371.1 SlyX family protein [Pseudomonadales bacterium]
MADLDQKLIGLEERMAFQEDTIHKLDDAMADQQKQLLDLTRQIQLLAEQLRKVEQGLPEAPQDEKPPHY